MQNPFSNEVKLTLYLDIKETHYRGDWKRKYSSLFKNETQKWDWNYGGGLKNMGDSGEHYCH